ncbi:MAG: aminopeptidase [bacterium]|nr:aminopeptidase [bacterium]
MGYKPPQIVLDKYADVLVNFALNGCKGIKPGEVVFLQVPECAKPLLISLRRSVLKSGAHAIIQYIPDRMQREFFELANEDQLKFFPRKYLKGKVNEADHTIVILAETDKRELFGIEPAKIMAASKVFKEYWDWREDKETQGKFTWTLGLYGTPAMAKEAGMSLEEYWKQIIKACFLDTPDPVAKWRSAVTEVERVKEKLNRLKIKTLRIKSSGTDLTVGIGPNRQFLGGSGQNIPSFEVFISPDARKTEGYITFNQPLYRYGNLINGVKLEFKNGRVTSATAREGEEILKEMIKVKNADKVGEFSLTDRRLSRITKFMAETLFDENRGGRYGNTHIALGSAYKDSYPGDPSKVSRRRWAEMGYNDSVIHTDIVSTENRIVTAHLTNGEKKIIYKDGEFII